VGAGERRRALTEKVLNRAMRRLFENEPPLLVLPKGRVTPHDLRRTARTIMGETLQIPPHVAERCLNHSLGRLVTIYDRGDYIDERRAALAKLDALLASMPVPPPPPAPMRKVRKKRKPVAGR